MDGELYLLCLPLDPLSAPQAQHIQDILEQDRVQAWPVLGGILFVAVDLAWSLRLFPVPGKESIPNQG